MVHSSVHIIKKMLQNCMSKQFTIYSCNMIRRNDDEMWNIKNGYRLISKSLFWDLIFPTCTQKNCYIIILYDYFYSNMKWTELPLLNIGHLDLPKSFVCISQQTSTRDSVMRHRCFLLICCTSKWIEHYIHSGNIVHSTNIFVILVKSD